MVARLSVRAPRTADEPVIATSEPSSTDREDERQDRQPQEQGEESGHDDERPTADGRLDGPTRHRGGPRPARPSS